MAVRSSPPGTGLQRWTAALIAGVAGLVLLAVGYLSSGALPAVLLIGLPLAALAAWAAYRERGRRIETEAAAAARSDELERRLAERDRDEARFRDFAGIASDWLWETDAELRFTYVSANVEAGSGAPAASYIGMRRTDRAALGVDAETARRFAEEMAARRPFKDQITRRQRADGSVWYAKASGRPIFAADGTFLGYRGASTNVTAEVTAREEAEQAHRRLMAAKRQSDETLALLDTLQSAAPVGFAFVDRELRHVRVNEALAGIDGLSVSDHVGRTIEEVVPDLWPQLGPVCAQVLERRQPVLNFEISGETPARPGELRHWLTTFYPVVVGDAVTGIGIVAIEVSELRRMEAQLRQVQKMEAIGNLSGGMAHDFNNLLGVVIGNLDLLCDSEGAGGEILELAKEARDAALRGADLTRRLLAFARRQPLQPRRVDVNDLVTGAVKLLGPLLGEDIEVGLDLGADLWPVVVDAAQLEASLANLATNARDAMPAGGSLTIATRNQPLDADYVARHSYVSEGDYVLIEVTDTGSGMPPDVASRVFEPFFTTKEQGRGTGLGLSMVFGFMKQSGGHINVYSEVGTGSTFRLYFPRAEAGAAAAEGARLEEPALRGADEVVLVVEDNGALRRVALRQLVELGYRVREAASAQAALELIALDPGVDVLFTDVIMPGGMDGRQLAEIARRRWPHIKVLLTSGFPGTVVARGKTTAPLLSKPYRKDQLARVLRELIEGGAGTAP